MFASTHFACSYGCPCMIERVANGRQSLHDSMVENIVTWASCKKHFLVQKSLHKSSGRI